MATATALAPACNGIRVHKKEAPARGFAGASGSVYGGTCDGEGKPIARDFIPRFPKSGVTPITY